jgi:hypothetical protein
MNPFPSKRKGFYFLKYHQSRVFYLQIFICKFDQIKYSSDCTNAQEILKGNLYMCVRKLFYGKNLRRF